MNFVTVAALLDDKYSHPLTPYVIGMTVFQGVLAGWHIGAGCMNPARVFAPAVIASGKSSFISWIYGLESIDARIITFFSDQDQYKSGSSISLHFIKNGMLIGSGGLVKLLVLVLQSSLNAWYLHLFTLAVKLIQTAPFGGGEFTFFTKIQTEKSISEERISLHGQLRSINTKIQIEKCIMLKLPPSLLHLKPCKPVFLLTAYQIEALNFFIVQ